MQDTTLELKTQDPEDPRMLALLEVVSSLLSNAAMRGVVPLDENSRLVALLNEAFFETDDSDDEDAS